MSASQGDFPDLGFPGTERATIVLTDEDGREQRFSVHFEVRGEEVAPLTWFQPEEISQVLQWAGPGGLFLLFSQALRPFWQPLPGFLATTQDGAPR